MLNPVKDRLGQGAVISTELVVPAAVVVLGAEDRGRRLSPGVEQFQDVMLFRLRGLQKEPFVQNQQSGVGVLRQNLSVVVLRPGNLQIQKQIREPDVLGLETLLTDLHAQRTGNIGLAAASGTGNEDVSVLRNVFAGCQPLNQRSVQLPAGGVVNGGNMCLRLVEASTLNDPLQAVVLPVGIFRIHNHPETVGERYILHLRIIQLDQESVGHGAEPHFQKLVYSISVRKK